MIPRRVKLAGFLCYKDEQDISFEGSAVWMLSGLNGSGKSAVFDALTYALFGHHRGGSINAGELINKESTGFTVEFEFLAEGAPYQIRRSLRRDARGGVKGTQNVFRRDAADAKWLPIPDTSSSDGFKAWVRDKIGLNFETFTSSVLLLQGRAEKLLDSKPSGRAEVLAGIVDLERYVKLHERADAQRKELKHKLENIQGQLTGVPEVTEIELIAAENQIDEAEQTRKEADLGIERLQNLEFRARQWADLDVRRVTLAARLGKAKGLIAESDAIEKSHTRFAELRQVIPHVLVIQEKQQAIAESERNTHQFELLKAQTIDHRTATQNSIETSKGARGQYQKSLLQHEQQAQTVGDELRGLAAQLGLVKTYEDQVANLKKLDGELARLPTDPGGALANAQKVFDRCVELGTAIPSLERFASAREQLRTTAKRLVDLKATGLKTREAGEHAKQVHADAKTKLDSATKSRADADEAATTARTLFKQASDEVDEFGQVDGQKNCRACGQPLTAAHLKAEKAKRDKELKAATAANKKATEAQTLAIAAERTARAEFEAADKELVRLRDAYRDIDKDAKLADAESTRLIGECKAAYLSLPPAERQRVSPTATEDWTSTTWPSAADLKSLKNEAGDLDVARATLREAQAANTKYEGVKAQRTAAETTLNQVKANLPDGDPAKLREREIKLKAEEETLRNQLRSTKKLIQEEDLNAERLNKELATIQETLATIDSNRSAEEASRVGYKDAIARAGKSLPGNWRETAMAAGLAEQNQWKAELEALERQGIATKFADLAHTRASIESLKQDMATVEQEAAGFTDDERRPADEVRARLTSAKQSATALEQGLQSAREAKAILDRHVAERARLKEESLAIDKDLNFAMLLAQLLGRDRLQRYLVRTAEKQIVGYANGVLDRLSDGQLFLKICGGDEGTGTDRALDLESYNRVTGGAPINVSFLSGSQRFRVAVSLALGIGQYASRQHRPIESVIIDEGFGCLDRTGRQVMIHELQNLRGHLKCILLVSHQEEFAEAFSDGYRFELANGATKVTRFRK